jgi:two-component system response regulator CpxR
MLPTRHMLVVDDDEDIRLSLADLLEESGFQVSLAANGREALARLRTQAAPSLILLDMMMPVMDGWELMEELQIDERLARIPIVVFSACRKPAPAAMAIVPRAVLSKPLSMSQLLAAIERSLV